jgi:hypothetical protein
VHYLKDSLGARYDLPESLVPADKRPPSPLPMLRGDGQVSQYTTADGGPEPGPYTLVGSVPTADAATLEALLAEIRSKLATATLLGFEEGAHTWERAIDTLGTARGTVSATPVQSFSHIARLTVKVAVGSGGTPVVGVTSPASTITLPDGTVPTGGTGAIVPRTPWLVMDPGGTTDQGEWLSATLTDNLIFSATVGHGGKFYVIGGEINPTAAKVYDPSTNAWSALASLPYPYESVESFAVASGDFIYVLGGRGASSVEGNTRLLRYSVSANTWSALASFSTARRRTRAILTGGLIYLIGGYNGITAYRLDTVEVYDITAGTWASGPTMNYQHADHVVALDGASITVRNGTGSGMNFAEQLVIASGYWSTLLPGLPGPGLIGSTFGTTSNGLVVAGGAYLGQDASEKGTVQTSLLDPETSQWAPMAAAPIRIDEFASGAVVNDVLYVVQQYDFLAFVPPGATAPTW